MQKSAWLKNAEEIAQYMGISKDSIKKLVESDGLPAKKIYRRWRALREDIDCWVKEKMKE